MKKCLLVIDAQESFRQRDYFVPRDLPAYITAQNALIEGCLAQGVPVVRVFHAEGKAAADNAFALESGCVRPLTELIDYSPAATFYKNRHSALVGTGLQVWLQQNGIGTLIISGIRTEQCCETTTRHASDLGFQVDFVMDATLTFDMTQPDGLPLSAADIKARTATVLTDRFARIVSVEQALKGLKGLKPVKVVQPVQPEADTIDA